MSKQKEHSSDKDKLITTEQQLKATIQQLQATNQQLRASQEEIQALAKLPSENPNPVLRISADGIILYANEASAPVLETWECKKGQRLPDNCYKRVEKVVNSGEISGFEFACRNDRIFSVTLAPIVDAGYVNAYGLDITERKQAEKALRESEEKYQDLYDNAPDMFVSVDAATGNILDCNKMTLTALGYGKEEIIGKHIRKMYHPDSEKERKKVFETFVEEGEVRNAELQLKRKDGSKLDVSLNVSAVRDEQGKTLYSRSIWRDITERKRAEEALRESEGKYKTLTESSLTGIFIHQDGRYVFVNDRFAEIHGYTPGELLEKEYWTLIHPDKREVVAQIVSKRLEGKEVARRYEIWRLKKDGQPIWCEMMANRIEYRGMPAIMGNIIDITERKRAEEALRDSEALYLSLVENLPQNIFRKDLEGRHIFANENYCRTLKRTPDEIIGKTNYDLFPAELAEKYCHDDQRVIETGEIFDTVEEHELPDGKRIYVHVVKTPLQDSTGKIIGTQGIFWDVTERKRAEEALRAANQQLQASEQQLKAANQQLLASEQQLKAANQQLQASEQQLKAANQQLRASEQQLKAANQQLRTSEQHLKSLASQLTLAEEHERHQIATELHATIGQSLVVSKLQLDTLRATAPGDISKTLGEVCNTLDETIQGTKSLTFDLSSPLLYELGFETAVAEWLTERIQEKHGIATEFKDDGQPKPLDDDIRVFLFRDVRELLINVVKHANAKKIKVSIQRVGNQIRVGVEDNGWGFDPAEIRATAVRKGGFGLFSIRERLEQLSGHLGIESAPGCGTKVTLIAPLKREKIDMGVEK